MTWGKCEKCGIETSNIEHHKCDEIQCAYCGYRGPKVYKKKLEGFHFGFTEPDYGDGWKCPKCEQTVTGQGYRIPAPSSFLIPFWSPVMSLKEAEEFMVPKPIIKIITCPKCGHEFEYSVNRG